MPRPNPPRADAVVITCEHGGKRIPSAFRDLFRGRQAQLDSHRGYDPGALAMARQLARAFDAPLVFSTVSRLLIELNRSPAHKQQFSDATRALPDDIRERIVARYYTPYREQVEALARRSIAHGRRVIHISSHSFTPELDGEVRTADVGLLYDPRRSGERALCDRWKKSFAALAPELRVRRNYPYAGDSDGLTRYLRSLFPASKYVGIELELNQKIALSGGRRWVMLKETVVGSLQNSLQRPR